jgi:hypothetical protein
LTRKGWATPPTVDLAGDGLTLRVKAQPTRALAVGRNTVIGNEISHGSASTAYLFLCCFFVASFLFHCYDDITSTKGEREP